MKNVINKIWLLPLVVTGLVACNGMGQTDDGATSTTQSLQSEETQKNLRSASLSSSTPMNFITAVAAGNNKFVAVGNDGNMKVSTNESGDTWTNIHIPNSTHFTAASFGENKFVVGGLGGQIFVSTPNYESDSTQWHAVSSLQNGANIRGITYGEDRLSTTIPQSVFVSVDDSGQVSVLYNASENPEINFPLSKKISNKALFAVTNTKYTDAGGTIHSAFVAVGSNGEVFRSTNPNNGAAGTWESETPATTNPLYAVTSNPNGVVVAAGSNGTIVTSQDGGQNWVHYAVPGATSDTFTGISYNSDGVFTVTGDHIGYVLASTDGVHWSKDSQPLWESSGVSNTLYATATLNNTTVLVGDGASMSTSHSKFAADTTNVPNANIKDMLYVGSHTYILVGSTTSGGGYIAKYSYTIANGWTLQPLTGLPTAVTNNPINAIKYANSTYVVVGNNGVVATSSDGENWVSQTSGTTQDLNAVTALDISGTITFSAVGNNVFLQSTDDGQTWTPGTEDASQPQSPNHNITSITTYSGNFLAVSTYAIPHEYPVLWTSNANGQVNEWSWASPIGVNFNIVVNSILYAGSKFVMVGNNGQVFYHPHGDPSSGWSMATTVTTHNLNKVIYKPSHIYLAVGDGGVTLQSEDTEHWESAVVTGVSTSLRSAACANDSKVCVVAGDNVIAPSSSSPFAKVNP